ncbi:MAG: tyrosine--tRNA ligase [Candidatus Thermoplasmatota archaeon]
MDAEDAFRSIRNAAAEVVSEDELRQLCDQAARGLQPRAYIGFEPSGTAHVGWMVCTDMVKRLVAAGFDVHILLADWHAQINDKLGGDLAAIQRCGRYMEQAFEALGVPNDQVRYVYANALAGDASYWAMVLKVQKNTTLARVRRAMTIMGRSEDEGDGDMSKFMYPAMQVADIFHMHIDLAYGGLDQRHAHMLARDVAPKIGRKPPTALHTPLVPSLKGQGSGRMDAQASVAGGAGTAAADAASVKMSKSDPDSGIFIHDAPEDIARKLKGAHCPAKEVEGNPVLDLLRLVVWPRIGAVGGALVVRRPEKFGGDKSYTDLEAVKADFASGALHPMDLKTAVASALGQQLEPVRAYFAKHPADWQFVQSLRKTR